MKKWFVLETVDDIIIGKTNAKAFDLGLRDTRFVSPYRENKQRGY